MSPLAFNFPWAKTHFKSVSSSTSEFLITPHADVMFVIRSINMSSPKALWSSNSSKTISSCKITSHTAISFFLKLFAGMYSPVLTSILYWIFVTIPGISFVPIFTKYSFPGNNSPSSIQRTVAVNDLLTGSSVLLASTHPLDTSTSRSNWIVTGRPFSAVCASLSPINKLLTFACSLLGNVTISSPTEICPDSICPWNPRNVWFGRHTLWTGM